MGSVRLESTRAEVAVDPTDVIARDGVELAVHDHGPLELPAAVVAHGVGSSPRFVHDAFDAPLRRAGYRLVTYDLRGHGESTPLTDPAAHRLDEQAADLGAVAEAVDARVVGGVSLGGHAAVGWAAGWDAAAEAGPDGLLVCLPGWLGPVPTGQGPHAAIAAAVREVGVRGVLERMEGDPEVPSWLRRLLLRDWSRCDPTSLGAALVALDGADGPTPDVLRDVAAPVGICAWPDDPGHPLEVAEGWVGELPVAALATTTMEAVGTDPAVLAETALDALTDARTDARTS